MTPVPSGVWRRTAEAEVRSGDGWRVKADRRRSWAAAGVLFLSAGLIHLLTLTRTPGPFVDEAYYASQAWGIIHTGLNYGPLQPKAGLNYPGYWTYYPWFGVWLESLAIRLLGLSLFSVRLLSLGFGLALLGAIYAIGRRLGGVRLGLLATFLVAISSTFTYSSHLARPDIMVAALGYGSVALYLIDGSPRLSVASVSSGLAVGLALDIHPNAIIYAPLVAGLYLVDHRWSAFRLPRFWGFAAGVGAGVAYFVAAHVLPYPQTYFALNYLNFDATHTPPLLVPDPAIWRRSLEDTAVLLAQSNPFEAALIPVGIAFLCLTKSLTKSRATPAASEALIALFSVLAVEFVAIVPYKPVWYRILLTPAVDLLLAAFFLGLLDCRPRRAFASRAAKPLGLGLLAGSIAFCTLLLTADLAGDASTDYRMELKHLQQAVPPGSTIMADPRLWFGLTDRRWVVPADLTYYLRDDKERNDREATFAEAFAAYHPDYLFVDSLMAYLTTDDPGKRVWWNQIYLVPKSAMDELLSARGHEVDEFRLPPASLRTSATGADAGDRWDGVDRLYHLTWK